MWMLLCLLCSSLFSDESTVLKNPGHLNCTTISMCSIEMLLLNSGWTGTGWVGINFLISKDNKPASWELSLYWEVCSAYDFPRGFLLFSMYTVIRLFDSVLKHSTLRTNVFTCFCLRLCQECQNLIENHDQIKLLSNVRNNLNTTLKVNAMSDLCFHQLFLYHDMFLAYAHTNIHKFLPLYICTCYCSAAACSPLNNMSSFFFLFVCVSFIFPLFLFYLSKVTEQMRHPKMLPEAISPMTINVGQKSLVGLDSAYSCRGMGVLFSVV